MPRKPRICRYIFNTLTVVSLLLMLVTAGLWVDSYGHFTSLFWSRSTTSIGWESHKGSLRLIVDSPNGGTLNMGPAGAVSINFPQAGWDLKHSNIVESINARIEPVTLELDWHRWGFGMGWGVMVLAVKRHSILLPHWFLTLVFAIGPAIWLFKWNKRGKLGPNACSSCGYDLTGNETGVCPECGANKETSAESGQLAYESTNP